MIFVLNRSKLTKRNICYGAKALVRFGAKRALAEPRGYFARGLNLSLRKTSPEKPCMFVMGLAFCDPRLLDRTIYLS